MGRLLSRLEVAEGLVLDKVGQAGREPSLQLQRQLALGLAAVLVVVSLLALH